MRKLWFYYPGCAILAYRKNILPDQETENIYMHSEQFALKTSPTQRRLEGKIAIITGASRGIGAAAARLFASEGASVVLASRSEEEMTHIVEEIRSVGGNALAVP